MKDQNEGSAEWAMWSLVLGSSRWSAIRTATASTALADFTLATRRVAFSSLTVVRFSRINCLPCEKGTYARAIATEKCQDCGETNKCPPGIGVPLPKSAPRQSLSMRGPNAYAFTAQGRTEPGMPFSWGN